jgi:RNA polymerase sigma factor (sigma-70 family)
MSVRSPESLGHYVRRLCDEVVPPDDAQLLKRFVGARDREAFELLIARHGPLVLGTARRLVDDPHDADDVFQAVFLSFARLAKSIRQANTIPAWLHKTTCRIAAKARKHRVERLESTSEPSQTADPEAGLVWREIRVALDEELQRLPERLRSPLLLCYVSGLARDEAARQLGWSLGTLKRRLEQGRKILRTRLERRGIAAAGLLVAVLTPSAMQAAVSKSLAESVLSLIFSKESLAPATVSVLVLHSASTMKGVAMKSILAILTAVGVGIGLYAAMGLADPPAKAEGKKEDLKPAHEEKGTQLDEPLPPGSTLRFGTSRFRHGVSMHAMSVSPDGKTAFVTNDSHMPRVFDLATGRVLFSQNWGSIEVGVFSPDGRSLVLKQGFDLLVVDAATGKQLRKIAGAGGNLRSVSGVLAFTPDGKAIATVSDGKDVHLFDFESGNTIRDFVHEIPKSGSPSDFSQVLAIAFSADGKRMASGGYANEKGNYFARLWDVETGKELHRFMHGAKGYGVASLEFTPDGKTLATLGTQGGVFVRLFDVETGKERRSFPTYGEMRPGHHSVTFSPDGKTVAAALKSIHLYDSTTGEERLRIDRRASDLHFTDDGKTLTGAVSGAIYRWDTATGTTLTPEAADSAVGPSRTKASGRTL